MEDLDKYVLEQAKIEVEHTRSWPTKILAFYVAINAGVVSALFAVTSRSGNPLLVPSWVKTVVTLAVVGLLLWAFALLRKNHKSYLRHRNVQVRFQQANKEEIQKRFIVPAEWFLDNDISPATRWQGWSFYFYIMILVTAFGLAGVWIS